MLLDIQLTVCSNNDTYIIRIPLVYIINTRAFCVCVIPYSNLMRVCPEEWFGVYFNKAVGDASLAHKLVYDVNPIQRNLISHNM